MEPNFWWRCYFVMAAIVWVGTFFMAGRSEARGKLSLDNLLDYFSLFIVATIIGAFWFAALPMWIGHDTYRSPK